MMEMHIGTELCRPGARRVHPLRCLHHHAHLPHHAMMRTVGATADWNVGLRLGLRDDRLQRQNGCQKQQKRSCNSSHSCSVTGRFQRRFVSHCKFAYKVSMPPNVQMTEVELFARLDNPTQTPLVITSNTRAARMLRSHYGQWQQGKNVSAWRTPRIQSWEAWLAEMWDELILAGAAQHVLLTAAQERHVWRSILRSTDSVEGSPVLYSNSLAELAQDSQRLLEEFCISSVQLMSYAEGKDTQAFLQWQRAFFAQCKRRDLLAPSALARILAQQVAHSTLSQSREIFLLGFDRVTSQQQQLLQALQQQGCSHAFVWLTPEMPSQVAPVVVAAKTVDEELRAAACWIRQRLLLNPQERIGVLAPSISELRDAMDRTFRSVLAPSTLDVHHPAQRLPYEFTLGVPLATLPQIRAALLLLRWLALPIAFDDASFLLVTNHVGGASSDARARLDAALRIHPQMLNGEPEFAWLLQRLQENQSPAIAPLQQSMSRVAALARDAAILADSSSKNSFRTHTAWRELVDEILAAAQWTLLQAKTSAEFQLLEKWNRLMDEIVTLDTIEDSVSFLAMLETLESTAAHTLHALETQEAPVQILGIAESAGMTFDAIWFLQASARAWPQRGQAQPWIPWPLQRQAAMPYVNPQADYDHACQVTQRVLASCKDAVFSFAMEDEAEESSATHPAEIGARISPILQNVVPNSVPVIAQHWLPDLAIQTREQIIDATLPVDREFSVPFTNAKVRHGVRFLKQQAACPFQAFAELRLGAASIEDPLLGLTALAQGNVVHEVLRLFWTQVQTQTALRALATKERRAILDLCIQQTLSKIPANNTMEQSLLSTEAERLCERLLAWLEVEAARPEFSVEAREQSIVAAVMGDVQFDCRIDRIDKVGNGLALLDYKTGQISASACDGERPDEPQLPAYAVLLRNTHAQNAPLHGVAFASLQARKPGFKVIHSLPQIFSTVNPKNSKSRTTILNTEQEFLAQVDQWGNALTQLAEHFRAGYAAVDPKIPGVTCTHCAQKILCRIQEAQLMENPTAEDNEEVEDSAETESRFE